MLFGGIVESCRSRYRVVPAVENMSAPRGVRITIPSTNVAASAARAIALSARPACPSNALAPRNDALREAAEQQPGRRAKVLEDALLLVERAQGRLVGKLRSLVFCTAVAHAAETLRVGADGSA